MTDAVTPAMSPSCDATAPTTPSDSTQGGKRPIEPRGRRANVISVTLEDLAQALGGDISGAEVLCPGPGHSAQDRSLSVKLSERSGDVVVHSFAGDDPITCKDYVREQLGWQTQNKENGKANGGSAWTFSANTYTATGAAIIYY